MYVESDDGDWQSRWGLVPSDLLASSSTSTFFQSLAQGNTDSSSRDSLLISDQSLVDSVVSLRYLRDSNVRFQRQALSI